MKTTGLVGVATIFASHLASCAETGNFASLEKTLAAAVDQFAEVKTDYEIKNLQSELSKWRNQMSDLQSELATLQGKKDLKNSLLVICLIGGILLGILIGSALH